MKVIFLNTWQGKIEDKFLEFIKENSFNTDIFCFQELNKNVRNKIKNILTEHKLIYFSRIWKINNRKVLLGQGIFIRKDNLHILLSNKKNLYKKTNEEPHGFLQFAKVKNGAGHFIIGNIHGKAFPSNKFDTDTRIRQSKNIIKTLKSFGMPSIFGGDFNLDLNTKSVKMFEKAGYRNLIKDHEVKTTRNKLAWDTLKNKEGFFKQYFADYVFVSPEIKVKSFEVPNIEISDHLPLILDFEVDS